MNGRGPADWMCTFSGVQYFPANPRVEDVRIADIAHALSMLCRYTGHTRRFYSVAEHSVHVSHIVPASLRLAGLMHDAPEAYMNDINRPLKRSLPDYKAIEDRNWAVIAKKFSLPSVLPAEIHEADVRVYLTERAVLMPPLPVYEALGSGLSPAPVKILSLEPGAAKRLFLDRYYELTKQNFGD